VLADQVVTEADNYLFIGKVGVRAFCEVFEVLSNYMTFFPPHNNVWFNVLTKQENQAILHDSLPPRYILKTKETDQQPLQMNYYTLRQFTLNIKEAARNPGVLSDQEDDEKQISSNEHSRKKGKADRIPKKNRGGGNKKVT
jgi:hypothetical protein